MCLLTRTPSQESSTNYISAVISIRSKLWPGDLSGDTSKTLIIARGAKVLATSSAEPCLQFFLKLKINVVFSAKTYVKKKKEKHCQFI